MKLQVLTSPNSWFYLNHKKILKQYRKYTFGKIITSHKKINQNTITIIVSYYKIIPKKYLARSRHNLVVHESNLPKGRGMSPLFWQIINGKKNVIFSLFECSNKIDEGRIYFKKKINFSKSMLYEEIKEKQMNSAFELIHRFVKKYLKQKNIKTYDQKGKPTYYKRLDKTMSEIDFNKSIKSQFNILRTRDNKKFPAFFYYKKRKYTLKIY